MDKGLSACFHTSQDEITTQDIGRYRHCYGQVKSAWNQIESFLQQRCPQAYSNLMASGGASEAELDKLERILQVQLPDDYRCSLRHRGKLSVLLGSVDYLQVLKHLAEVPHVNHQTFKLKAVRDVQFASIRPGKPVVHVNFLAIGENISSHPRTSRHQHLLQSHHSLSKPAETAKELLLMVSSDEGAALTGFPIGHVFTAFSSPISYGMCRPGGCCPDRNRLYEWFRMRESSTFADWLSAEAHRLQHYYINQQGQLTRFILKPWSEAVTGYFTVRVATVAINVNEEVVSRFHCQTFAMCLAVELSEDAQAENSCLLEGICLRFREAYMQLYICSVVQNPSPQVTLHPGGVIEYVSNPLPTMMGVIEDGYIVMRTIQKKLEIRVRLPQITFTPLLAQRFTRADKRLDI